MLAIMKKRNDLPSFIYFINKVYKCISMKKEK